MAKPTPDQVRRLVLRAVYHLQRHGPERGPTIDDIAKHYKLDVVDVALALRELKADRLIRDRSRQGVKVWQPWD